MSWFGWKKLHGHLSSKGDENKCVIKKQRASIFKKNWSFLGSDKKQNPNVSGNVYMQVKLLPVIVKNKKIENVPEHWAWAKG